VKALEHRTRDHGRPPPARVVCRSRREARRTAPWSPRLAKDVRHGEHGAVKTTMGPERAGGGAGPETVRSRAEAQTSSRWSIQPPQRNILAVVKPPNGGLGHGRWSEVRARVHVKTISNDPGAEQGRDHRLNETWDLSDHLKRGGITLAQQREGVGRFRGQVLPVGLRAVLPKTPSAASNRTSARNDLVATRTTLRVNKKNKKKRKKKKKKLGVGLGPAETTATCDTPRTAWPGAGGPGPGRRLAAGHGSVAATIANCGSSRPIWSPAPPRSPRAASGEHLRQPARH